MAEQDARGIQANRRFGAYVVRKLIGEGGFGAVYLAHQDVLQREAVLKVLRPSHTAEASRVEQFLQEARLASRVDHPYAAHVYDFGAEDDGTLWIAMELVRGTSLADMLKAGALPRARAIPLLYRICEVVHTLHEQGIIHRDIKPHNIMVISRAGTMFPKLLDLGIASEMAQSVATGERDANAVGTGMAGTPMYMAPEQWVTGAPISPATDVYALGVLAFEMLAGHPPFDGATVMDVARHHARTPPPQLPTDVSHDQEDINPVLFKAMAKRPRERYASALALGEALRDASGLAVEAVDLPQLAPALCDELLIAGPQPVAECIAVLEASRTPAALRQAVWQTTFVLANYTGNIALALRQRTTGRLGDAPEVTKLLDTLATTNLDATGWWQLTRELVRPFADVPALYPMAELVEVFFTGGSALKTAMDALLAAQREDPGPKGSADEIRTFLVGAIALLGKALQALGFLRQYPIAVVRDNQVAFHMGLRRPARLAKALALDVEGVVLLDGDNQLVGILNSVALSAESSPGAPEELFWLVGAHNESAKLQALPQALEVRRDDLWVVHLGGQHAERRLLARGGASTNNARGPASPELPPYLGLATFGVGDADRYFGRENEVLAFVNRLQGRRLIAVVGPSGSGKSSFVQAGVVPNLPARHQVVVLRPGSNPLESLRLAGERLGVSVTVAGLARQPQGLALALLARAAVAEGNQEPQSGEVPPVMLVVDQFEELVTMCLDIEVQAQFAAALLGIVAQEALAAQVILTLRDDFLIRVAQVPGLRERLSTSLQLLTTPQPDDLRRILTEPARRVGYAFEDAALVEEMTQEVASQPAALALLSFTAFQLWQFRDKHAKNLTRKAYRALGGVGGALAHHADSVVETLDDRERKFVREIFRHLVTADGTRASLSRDEILQVAGGAEASVVLERLISARLLVAQEGPDGAERIEVIHEALLNAWPRLVKWRHEDAEGARLRDQLRVAAKQWSDRARDKGLLWRGDTLTEYRLWRARYPGTVTALEEAFAAASVRDAKRTQRIRRIAAGLLIAALLVTTVIFGKLRKDAVVSEARASTQLTQSYVEQGRRALLSNDLAGAVLALHYALRRHSQDPALGFMLARSVTPMLADLGTLSGHRGGIWSLAFSPDRARLLTSSEDGTVLIFDVGTHAQIQKLVVSETAGLCPLEAVWLDDGRIATSGFDGVVRLWDAHTGNTLKEQRLFDDCVRTLTWHAPSRVLIASSQGRVVKRWNPETDEQALLFDASGSKPGLLQLARTAEGAVAAVLQTSSEIGPYWLIDQGGDLHTYEPAGVLNVAPSPRGEVFATAQPQGRAVDLRRVSDGKILSTLGGHDQHIGTMAFSDSGNMFASGSYDASIRVTKLTSKASFVLRSHRANIMKLLFLGDDFLVSISSDGNAKLWDINHQRLVITLPHGGNLWNVVYDSERKLLATASKIGTVKLWSLDGAYFPLTLGYGSGNSANFIDPPVHNGGDTWVYADDDGFSAWNLARRTHARAANGLGMPGQVGLLTKTDALVTLAGNGILSLRRQDLSEIREISREIARLAASPAGNQFVAIDGDNQLRWYDGDGALVATHPLKSAVEKIVWAQDGGTVVILGKEHVAVFDGHARQPLAELAGEYFDIGVAPDGQTVLTATLRSVFRWDRAGLAKEELMHSGLVFDMTFSPDGTRLYVGVGDGNVFVWDMGTGQRLATLEGTSEIRSVEANSEYIVGLTATDEVMIWDAIHMRLVHRYAVNYGSLWAGIDPRGRWLLSVDDVGTLTLQDFSSLTDQQRAPGFLETLIATKIEPEIRARLGFAAE